MLARGQVGWPSRRESRVSSLSSSTISAVSVSECQVGLVPARRAARSAGSSVY